MSHIKRSRIAEIRAQILDGIEISEQQFPQVGLVSNRNMSFICTGTLVSDVHVLFAAHCTPTILNDTDGIFQVRGIQFSSKKITIHPDYNEARIGYDDANDLAIMELEASPNLPAAALLNQAPQTGDEMVIVGFGLGGSGEEVAGTAGIKRMGVTYAETISDNRIIWQYDIGEANTALGDSGGPAFIDGAVAAVTSGGSDPNVYGSTSFSTRVDVYLDWIRSIIHFQTAEVLEVGFDCEYEDAHGATQTKKVTWKEFMPNCPVNGINCSGEPAMVAATTVCNQQLWTETT